MLRQKVIGSVATPRDKHDMTIPRILQPRQAQLSYQASVNGDHASELGHNVLMPAGGLQACQQNAP
jgi:hypothetical protein